MALATWRQDRMHLPQPVTPMSAWLATHFSVGFTSGLAAYGVPLGVQTCRLNTYFFMAVMPNIPPELMPEMEAKAGPRILEGVGNFWSRWENEWLPEIKHYWDDWAAIDLRAADDDMLRSAVDRMTAIYERIWTIHFELLVPAFVSISEFQDLYARLFPGGGTLDAYHLLQGGDSKSLEVDRELWNLSRVARADPAIRRAIESSATSEIHGRLEASPAGREFLRSVQSFLAVYGRRGDTVQELADPSWTENPTPAFASIKAYLSQDDDPELKHRKLAAERDQLVARAREAIKDEPEAVRGQFELLLAGAQAGSRAQEDHNYWIDQRGLHEVRQLCLELGSRMAGRGQLESKHDIFMLSMEEAREVFERSGDARALVAERRAEIDQWRKVEPPQFVGTDYGPLPDNPLVRAIFRFFGGPVEPATTTSQLRGNPGSPGIVTATARVIFNIQEGGRLKQGEILVAPTTSPPWTPLFATAGGIVTETGGALSHCAIVAREYGIPAVVGASGATALIKDGATIEVDGSNGSVRILS